MVLFGNLEVRDIENLRTEQFVEKVKCARILASFESPLRIFMPFLAIVRFIIRRENEKQKYVSANRVNLHSYF